MACEQAVRRGGSVTDSLWLVLAFQILYVADGLYNEVRKCFYDMLLSHAHRLLACHLHYHGYYHRWVRLHACRW